METAPRLADSAAECQHLLQKCESHSLLGQLDWIQRAHGDFNIWCFGLKATSKGKSSLERALRSRIDVGHVIDDLLGGLKESIEASLNFADETISDDIQGLPKQVDTLADRDGPLSEEIFSIQTILKQLNRIHIAIRRYGANLRHQKADSAFFNGSKSSEMDLFKEELIVAMRLTSIRHDPMKAFDIASLQQSLSTLHHRLITANMLRRNRIHHATKGLRKDLESRKKQIEVGKWGLPAMSIQLDALDQLQSLATLSNSTPQADMSESNEITSKRAHPQKSQTPSMGESSRSLENTAIELRSNFQLKLSSTKKAGTMVTNITRVGGKQDYPKCPKMTEIATSTPCPYCAEPLDMEYSVDDSRWRGHLASDLLPYSCIFENCRNAAIMYGTADDLTRHVKTEHGTRQWVCDYCAPQLDDNQMVLFDSPTDWCDHVMASHSPSLTMDQLEMLSKNNMRCMVPAIGCPLCSFESHTLQGEIPEHILEHLHSFALRSLPWGTGHSEADSEEVDQQVIPDDDEASISSSANSSVSVSHTGSGSEQNRLKELFSILAKSVTEDAREGRYAQAKYFSQSLSIIQPETFSSVSATMSEKCIPPILRALKLRNQNQRLEIIYDPTEVEAREREYGLALGYEIEQIMESFGELNESSDLGSEPGHLEPEAPLRNANAILRDLLGEELFEHEAASVLAFQLEDDLSAIKLAAAFIRAQVRAITISDYNTAYQAESVSLAGTLHSRKIGVSSSTYYAWQVTRRHLAQLDERLLNVLNVMSMFSDASIPQYLLFEVYFNSYDTRSYATGENSANFRQYALDLLQSYGVISLVKDDEMYRTHQGIRKCVRESLQSTEKYTTLQNQLISGLEKFFPIPDFENWPGCEAIFDHAQGVFDDYDFPSGTQHISWARLMNRAGSFARAKGKLLVAKQMFSMAIQAWDIEEMIDSADYAESQHELAKVSLQLGDFEEADNALQRCYRDNPGLYDSLELMPYDTMLHLLVQKTGTIDQLLLQRIHQRYEEVIERTGGTAGSVWHSALVSTAFFLRGEYSRSKRHDQQTRSIRVELQGYDHPDSTTSLSHLASSCFALHQYDEAETMEAEAFNRSRHLLGLDHPDTLTSYSNLASIRWYRSGAPSIDIFRSVLSIRAAALGPNHPSTLTSMYNLGCILMYQDRLEEALDHMGKAFTERCRIFGTASTAAVEAGMGMADIMIRKGQYERAEAIMTELVKDCRGNLDLPPDLRRGLLENTALILVHFGNYVEALEMLQLRSVQRENADYMTSEILAGRGGFDGE